MEGMRHEAWAERGEGKAHNQVACYGRTGCIERASRIRGGAKESIDGTGHMHCANGGGEERGVRVCTRVCE